MYIGLLHLHNVLRWVILILLLLAIFQSFAARNKPNPTGIKRTSLYLLIATHITVLIGLYQWLVGELGLTQIRSVGMGEIMKNSAMRFWAIEHLSGMLIAAILITIARGKIKSQSPGIASWLYVVAFLIIIASIPWPFRESIGRPWFPGM